MHSLFPKASRRAPEPAPVHFGNGLYHPAEGDVTGEHVTLEGEPYVCIRNVDALKPFFMSIVSDGDLWIFAGSNSPFTAGRSNPDQALFPYQTADKIMRNADSAGAMTLLLVRRGEGEWTLWEPWRSSGRLYSVTRNLYKHASGSAVVFEEINHDLGLRLRWSLTASETFGLVRECELENVSGEAVSVRYLDGWHHLLPAGVSQDIYARLSYLAAAYMRHERAANSVLGIYTLNSRISDRAEPVESLRASCAWSIGHQKPVVLLSTRQVEAFRNNRGVMAETEVRGEFGAYLVADRVDLAAEKTHRWTTVTDTGADHSALLALERGLKKPAKLEASLQQSILANRRGLRDRIAAADGLQDTADRSASVHHFANVLFNCMRGGTFTDSYSFPGSDFGKFLKSRNSALHEHHQAWLDQLPQKMTLEELDLLVAEQNDPQLKRLAREYLPLTFSRRHGDPSRPWNRFVIRVKNDQNEAVYDYQGNWRDIFQNWESLAHSYPAALERMIAVFLNASTADGYNPYRVTRAGIDWEVHDPNDPWSHIGYWGDHQLIYLLRLLQACESHYPGRLTAQLGERLYAYASVPYEIRGFDEIERDPGNSIRFNEELHKRLLERAAKIGNDGKLLSGGKGKVALISLAEKLLVPLLAKLSNFVPGGGIWMNTQRPDWNDANNALVGWGLSMVTVYQMRKYIQFVDALFAAGKPDAYEVSRPVAVFAAEVATILVHAAKQKSHSAAERYSLLEALGRAGELYRASVYDRKVHENAMFPVVTIRRLLAGALAVADDTIRANRREDGMYHSYNLLQIDEHAASVKRLQLMLEGQVGALSCGLLTSQETVTLLQAMAASDLYRADQDSYMLYPDRTIDSFLSRNTLPKTWRDEAPLLAELVEARRSDLVVLDDEGGAHFQADMTNAGDLSSRLDRLAKDSRFRTAVARDRAAIMHVWEKVFDHSTFLGRSGTMFAFEGLGSIYWHMVAKLLLAVQENYGLALKGETDPDLQRTLGELYHDVRRGLGFTKTPQIYGAFPSDPYSHSPAHLGAQQPGMTGQVKEEILTRWGELGVQVIRGSIHFRPTLLHAHEFFDEKHAFSYLRLNGEEATWVLPPESLGFTYCQVPICYHLAEVAAVSIERKKGPTHVEGNKLSMADSAAIFSRSGSISRVMVHIPRGNVIR
jgi:hypothetical protein